MSKQGFLKVGHYKKSMGQSSKRETRRPRGHSLKLIKKKKKGFRRFYGSLENYKNVIEKCHKVKGLRSC